jgi:hypothetical protein
LVAPAAAYDLSSHGVGLLGFDLSAVSLHGVLKGTVQTRAAGYCF